MSQQKSVFTNDDVQVINTEKLYQGFFALNRYTVKHALFNGSTSEEIKREVFERGHAVGVLLFDPNRDELVLLEQFRFPAMETSQTPWLIEVVAGIIEPGEKLEDVCHREAQEEAGLTLQHLTKINTHLTSPGACTERMHLYVAQVDSSQASGIHGLDSEAEDIRVFSVKLEQAKQWLSSGKIDNSTAIIALQWLLLNKADLLASWQNSD